MDSTANFLAVSKSIPFSLASSINAFANKYKYAGIEPFKAKESSILSSSIS